MHLCADEIVLFLAAFPVVGFVVTKARTMLVKIRARFNRGA